MRSRRAFTLVELILVTMILATIAAIAVPRYANAIANYRLDASARRVRADLETARETARHRSLSVTVDFSVDNDRYAASHSFEGVGELTNLGQEPYVVDLDAVDFGGSTTIEFNGFGIPTSAGTVTIRSGTATRTITVEPSGEVQIS